MLKYIERVGEVECTYEGETVQDVINLKNALNPNALVVKMGDPFPPSVDLAMREIQRFLNANAMKEMCVRAGAII